MASSVFTPNLLNGATANGDGDIVTISRQGKESTRYAGSLFVWGTFDGATVTLKISPDGTEWFDVTDGAFTAKSSKVMENYAKYTKATVSSAGASTEVYACII